jgi:hypothetical protein
LKSPGARPVDRNLLWLFYSRMISIAMTTSRDREDDFLLIAFHVRKPILNARQLRLDLQVDAQQAASADAHTPFAGLGNHVVPTLLILPGR